MKLTRVIVLGLVVEWLVFYIAFELLAPHGPAGWIFLVLGNAAAVVIADGVLNLATDAGRTFVATMIALAWVSAVFKIHDPIIQLIVLAGPFLVVDVVTF
jgi:hypothetical protein